MTKAKPIMVQGTASSAGKSLLAAGLCRLFKQDGYTVAPFKSQNMSSLSYTMQGGLEISQAQAFQAEAAGIAPSVFMNPVLLKPVADAHSHVVVNGRPWDSLPAADYYRRKSELRPLIQEAYDTLAAQYDIVVLEGAGSPAEINLQEGDFVNMGMAAMADAPVLLVGDIDMGGVFASLYGTVMLVEERPRIKGMVINKFRGDPELLRPNLVQIEELCHVPVLGVVPWLNLDFGGPERLCEGAQEGSLHRQKQFDLLADALRQALDVGAIYQMMGVAR